MRRLHGQFGRLGLAIALAALGQLPAAAQADALFTEFYGATFQFVWAVPLVPADAVPAYSGVGPPLVSTDGFSNELFVSGNPTPGLQFSLDPVEEEVFLGWRFKF